MTQTERYHNSILHRTCRFCAYYNYHCRNIGYQSMELHECKLKDKYIKNPNRWTLCKYFRLNTKKCKEAEEFIQDKIKTPKESNISNDEFSQITIGEVINQDTSDELVNYFVDKYGDSE